MLSADVVLYVASGIIEICAAWNCKSSRGVQKQGPGRLFGQGVKIMSLIAWIVLGLIAGFVASKLVNRTGEGIVLDIALGVVGAVLGGWIFNRFGATGVTGLNVWSLVVAVVGAVVLLLIVHAIRRATLRA
jgi:uncharacterized membrane protein YeaQ/YmgE (transglycosylase-associated protein family)